jgi:hypothetical protein
MRTGNGALAQENTTERFRVDEMAYSPATKQVLAANRELGGY